MYLPTDHKSAIRQDFAASLLLTPLFFSRFLVEFLGSNEKRMGVKGLYRGQEPVARWGAGDRPPVSPVGGPPSRPNRPPLTPRAPG